MKHFGIQKSQNNTWNLCSTDLLFIGHVFHNVFEINCEQVNTMDKWVEI